VGERQIDEPTIGGSWSATCTPAHKRGPGRRQPDIHRTVATPPATPPADASPDSDDGRGIWSGKHLQHKDGQPPDTEPPVTEPQTAHRRHHSLRQRGAETGRRAERTIHHLVRRGAGTVPTGHPRPLRRSPDKPRPRHAMSSPSQSPEGDTPVQTTLDDNPSHVGLITRVISWAVDLLLINLVAIITGLGAELIVGLFPITKNLKPVFLAIAGVVYVVWTAAYFVVFWSMSGQTPGSRVMQVRLVTPGGGKVKPVRALVRWVGMNLAMLPLPWGFVPIPFGRLGFPDWLAHTRVVEAQGLSLAAARKQRTRDARERARQAPPPTSPKQADSQPFR
jgi:uncharacterized RDD family membrane protein YckC